jgi:hypothetical protein
MSHLHQHDWSNPQIVVKMARVGPSVVAHTCNPSYSGYEDQELSWSKALISTNKLDMVAHHSSLSYIGSTGGLGQPGQKH